jgi:hypothetical protein
MHSASNVIIASNKSKSYYNAKFFFKPCCFILASFFNILFVVVIKCQNWLKISKNRHYFTFGGIGMFLP